MASFVPYTYIQCPCNDTAIHTRSADGTSSPSSRDSPDDDDERTFDPRSPRSNYSLYPLEYLLYCDVCHQIRCPRCVAEELVTIYCPNCLFEVGSSSLKTEGNRCTRSCFQCPICIGPLAVQSLESAPEPSLLTAESASATPPSGPWILACSYCNWNSAEIGVKFDKPQGIFSQLSKLRHGDDHSKHSSSTGDVSPKKSDAVPVTTSARFAAMKSFYNAQNNTNSPNSSSLSNLMDYGLSSPGALTRIMNLYSGNSAGLGKPKAKSSIMREADSTNEGFRVADLDDSAAISKLRRDGWDGTVTGDQSRLQVEEGARFANELWPIPYLLRTKRSKRCPVCRHIISKPESKVGNTRWRIRLVANNSIPSISIKPLTPTPSTPGTSDLLVPLQPAQFLLTFKNPMFEEIKVTLATPATTPGRFASRVTVLCPQFHIDANTDTDMYLDDVLKDGEKGAGRKRGDESTSQQAEAGKIWERGRNWVSIVVEVVPASLRVEERSSFSKSEGDPGSDRNPLKEDEDILEIPMFIRLEWEGDVSQDQVGAAAGKEKDTREKKELAYWCAIGIGRISQE
ncbi:dynactin p62 [Daldinia loculata]|uniref:dynactin p62 n=1 Tax=Daldinia loculata TaxID=103429 RepID=UPI0020C30263|nr:dynactin p62 [Daldinia loculata]KAI1645348.1 dynactin p62 [Daldinia loculata]